MNFLNCNYPGSCKIPKGKPKELKKVIFEIKMNGASIIVQKLGTIWFERSHYYWGIELDIKYNNLKMISEFETVGAVNIALLNWNGETLNNENEYLLYKYLKIIR